MMQARTVLDIALGLLFAGALAMSYYFRHLTSEDRYISEFPAWLAPAGLVAIALALLLLIMAGVMSGIFE